MDNEQPEWVMDPEATYAPEQGDFALVDRRQHQFAMIDYPVIDHMAEIGVKAFAVYVALVRCTDKHRRAWPKWPWIQCKTGLGRDAIRKAIRTLEIWRFIGCQQGRRGGNYASNLYIIYDLTDWEQPTDVHDKMRLFLNKNVAKRGEK